MSTGDEETTAQRLGKLGSGTRAALIKQAAEAYGGRPANAQPVSHERELLMWMFPTSPAAVEALKLGGDLATAELANQKWSSEMKAQQQHMRTLLQQQGLPKDQIDAQIKQRGLHDAAIFEQSRRYAATRARAHAQDDPVKAVEWHEQMAKRAAAWRSGQTMLGQTDGEEVQDDATGTDGSIY